MGPPATRSVKRWEFPYGIKLYMNTFKFSKIPELMHMKRHDVEVASISELPLFESTHNNHTKEGFSFILVSFWHKEGNVLEIQIEIPQGWSKKLCLLLIGHVAINNSGVLSIMIDTSSEKVVIAGMKEYFKLDNNNLMKVLQVSVVNSMVR